MNGTVVTICVCPIAGQPMQVVEEVEAIAGHGLKGDRYSEGHGSFNQGEPGRRQVTLINASFLRGSSFDASRTRRNIATVGVELMYLIGREFRIGSATFRGVKYCDPCNRPSKLAGIRASFQKEFFDRGGLVAEVVTGGMIKLGDAVIPPPKNYKP